MKVLGIKLMDPDKASLLAAFFSGGILVIFILCLTAFEAIPTMVGVMLSVSAIGGALANAYGVSIKENGLRGAIVSTGFSGLLMAITYVLITFIS